MDINAIFSEIGHAMALLNAGEKVDLSISISNDSISVTDYSQSTSIPTPTYERKVATAADHRLFLSNAISGMELEIPLRLGAALIDAKKAGCGVSFTIDPPYAVAAAARKDEAQTVATAIRDAVEDGSLKQAVDWDVLQPGELRSAPSFFGSIMQEAKEYGMFATVTVEIDGRPSDEVA